MTAPTIEIDGETWHRDGSLIWPLGTPGPGQVGHLGRYYSPFGKLDGLRARIRKWCDAQHNDRNTPFTGLGVVADWELALQILNLREFAEWLRVQPGPHADFANEIIEAADAGAELDDLRDHIVHQLGKPEVGASYHDAITDAATAGETIDDVRGLLVELGMLADGDTETELAPLLRALLS